MIEKVRKSYAITSYAITATVVATLAFGATVNAPTNVQAQNVQAKIEARVSAAEKKLEAACSNEITKWCSTVTPGQGRLLNCLIAYLDQVSAKCDSTVFTETGDLHRALGSIYDIADNCGNDIQKYCANLPDRGHTAQCLVDRKLSLTPACRSKVSKLFPVAMK